MKDYIIHSDVNWPGCLPHRNRNTRRGRGYATWEAANARLRLMQAHYNSKFGRGTNHRIEERS